MLHSATLGHSNQTQTSSQYEVLQVINNHVVGPKHDHDLLVVVVHVHDVRIQQNVAPYVQLYDVQVQDQCCLVSVLLQQPLGLLGHVSSAELRSVR